MSKFLKLAAFVFALLILHGNPANAAWLTMNSYSAWPQNAATVANYFNSSPTRYICRAYYAGGVHPGWTTPDKGYCAFGWGGLEQDSSTYDLWVDDWQPASNGNVPANAIVLGYERAAVPQPGLSLQVPRYVCQAYDPENGLASGKVAPDIGGCDFPWGGVELHATTYNVLVDSSLSMIDKSIGTVYPASVPDPSEYSHTSMYYVNRLNQPGTGDSKGDVKSGYEANGGPALAVCSVYYQDGYQIGKYRPGFPGCDISYGGQEIYTKADFPADYFDLVLNWMENPNDENGWSGGEVPVDQPAGDGFYNSAIIGGQEQDGSSLYLCTAIVDAQNDVVPGKLRPGLGGCSVAWNGKESIISPYYPLGETYSKTPPRSGPR